MHYMYVFSFDMLTPMLSVRTRPHSFRVESSWIKVGITNNIRSRLKSYNREYMCAKCKKSHIKIEKVWETSEERPALEQLEQDLKHHIELHRHRGEYYSNKNQKKIIEILDDVSFLQPISFELSI